MARERLLWAPGSSWAYSNMAFDAARISDVYPYRGECLADAQRFGRIEANGAAGRAGHREHAHEHHERG